MTFAIYSRDPKYFAVTKALRDAGLPYSAIEQAAVGYVYGEK